MTEPSSAAGAASVAVWGSDASARFLVPYLDLVEERLGPGALSELLERWEVSAKALRDETAWLTIDFLAEFSEAIVALDDSGALFAEGARLGASPRYLGVLYPIVRILGSPLIAYRSLPGMTQRLNRFHRVEVTDEGRGRLLVRYRVPEGRTEPSRHICTARTVQLAAVPGIWGLPDARVVERSCHHDDGGDACVYEIHWQRRVQPTGSAIGLLCGGALGLLGSWLWGWPTHGALSLVATGGLVGAFFDARRARAEARRFAEEQNEVLSRLLEASDRRFHEAVQETEARRAAEQRLQEQNETLRETLARVQRLQVEAEAASRAKSDFLANISHELRTPMNSIVNFNSMLLDGALDPEQRRLAERVQISADQLHSSLGNILDFAEVDAGTLVLEPRPLELAPFLGDIQVVVRRWAQDAALDYEDHVADDLPKAVLLDGGRLRQVLLNLLSNAVKFTEAGQVRLSVEHEVVAPGRVRLLFTVSDTGPGVTSECREELFAAFSQADTSSTRRVGGLGLGLSLTARILRLFGVPLEIDSRTGSGSTFRFSLELPVLPATEPVVEPPERSEPASRSTRVLLVEDSPFNQLVTLMMLEKLGCECDAVSNGQEALDALADKDYGLVLMDCQMPVMDGYEATRRIRDPSSPVRSHGVPVVAVTAHAMPGDRQKCLACGMDDYVPKPIDMDRLRAAVERWLGASSLA